MLTTIACCACTGATSGNAPLWDSAGRASRNNSRERASLAMNDSMPQRTWPILERTKEKLPRGFDLLRQHRMRATRIALQVHFSSHGTELIRRCHDPAPGHMRIGIPGTKQRRHPGKATRMAQVHIRRTAQTSVEGNDTAIPRRVSGRELRRQAGALGEPTNKNALQRNAGIDSLFHDRTHFRQCRRQPRLVLLDGRKEGKRGPAMIGRLWG